MNEELNFAALSIWRGFRCAAHCLLNEDDCADPRAWPSVQQRYLLRYDAAVVDTRGSMRVCT